MTSVSTTAPLRLNKSSRSTTVRN